MNSAEQYLKRIQDKLQQLLKNYTALQKENIILKKEVEKTKEQASNQQKSVDDLKRQLDVLKFKAGKMSASDKKEFEKRINSYLKEIDRCITLLGK